jgi:hypothetical protein
MTPKGAAMVIDTLSLRVFEIQETKERLSKEEEQLKARIKELEQIRDRPESIQPTRIIEVGS